LKHGAGERGEMLQSVKEEMGILQTIKRRQTNWVGHILHRQCHLKHDIEGWLEGGRKTRKKTKAATE
jgi:hypothetical protein